MKITSTEPKAIVRVNETDVGPAPIDVLRPAGNYQVQVQEDGFVPYKTQVTLRPGEEVKLNAALVAERPSLFTRWWFWSGAAVVIAGGVTATYFATRPAPQPPDFDRGSANWLVTPSARRIHVASGFHF
jgi:hypothetical protein